MTNVTVTELNEYTVLVKPEFHIISGRKKLHVEDLNLPVGVELPPEQIASLGSKKFIDPSLIAQFNRVRDQAKRACEKIGVRFLGGYAVPFEEIDDLSDELEHLMNQFESIKTSFIANYDKHINDWCAANPEWANVVRKAVTPKSVVANSLSADFVLYQVSTHEGVNNDRLNSKVSGLGERVYEEIAQEARKFVDESLSDGAGNNLKLKTDDVGVTQKALRPIRRMRDKMEGLAFLDSGIRPAVQYIDSVLEDMPEKGYIRDTQFNNLLMLSLSMTDPSKIKILGAAVRNDAGDSDVMNADDSNESLDVAEEVLEGEVLDEDVNNIRDQVSRENVIDAVFEDVEFEDEAVFVDVENDDYFESLLLADDNDEFELDTDSLDVDDNVYIKSDFGDASSSQASFF
jgi:hypothetical protein